MAAPSVLTPPPPVNPPLPTPSRPPTAAGPRATLPPALLASAAALQTPLRCSAPAGAASSQGSKKRSPPLPPSGEGAKKPKTAQHTPPASRGSVVATVTAERRRALDRKVAGCFVSRRWGGPAAARQEGRSWMEEQRGGAPLVGGEGEGEVVVPRVRAGDGAEAFAEYARWRRSVRIPSRFYIEHVRRRAINAGQDDCIEDMARRRGVPKVPRYGSH